MALLDELPANIQGDIYKDFFFEDFLDQFKMHFVLKKPEIFQNESSLAVYFDWPDS